MDELLREFLTETAESLDHVDAQLVRFEREPNNGQVLGNIFRLVHTIKGTCGFLGLPRLEALMHAAETLLANITRVPLAGRKIAGVLNLRGRIVTVIDLANRLSSMHRGTRPRAWLSGLSGERNRLASWWTALAKCSAWQTAISSRPRSISTVCWTPPQTGVFHLDEKILVALDASRMLDFGNSRSSAAGGARLEYAENGWV
jgi:chemotaxis signal transduction protein